MEGVLEYKNLTFIFNINSTTGDVMWQYAFPSNYVPIPKKGFIVTPKNQLITLLIEERKYRLYVLNLPIKRSKINYFNYLQVVILFTLGIVATVITYMILKKKVLRVVKM